ncbi:hypothetical protein BH10ACT9_BH10ACT9_43190 [soil metagenome]
MSVLTAIAPEVDPASVDDETPLREQVDLDSMDWLNFLRRIHRLHGIDIPESDDKYLRTIRDVVDYVGRRVPG